MPEEAPNQPPAADPIRRDLAYIAISLGLIAIGLGLFLWALAYDRGGSNLGFAMMHALGAVLISLGVALFLYRVLERKDVTDLMKIGGSAAGGLGMFGLIFALENYSLDFLQKAKGLQAPPSVQARTETPAVSPDLTFVARIDNSQALDGQQDFDGRRMRFQVIEPWAASPLETAVDETGYAAFAKYLLDGQPDHLTAELRPAAIRNVRTEVFRKYTASVCVRPSAKWAAVRQVSLTCTLGARCQPTPQTMAVVDCGTSGTQAWVRPILAVLAPPAHAQAPDAGWVVPDLAGACLGNRKLGETFYRFDVAAKAPAGAQRFSYALRVNDVAVYINGDRDHVARLPVAAGKAALRFALQNAEFAGAHRGEEHVRAAFRFYDAAGKPLAGELGSTYAFTALRAPPRGPPGPIEWAAVYVIGREKDGQQILAYSGQSATEDVGPLKRKFDALGLGFNGTPVVAIARPALGAGGVAGLDLALRQPDGRLNFTFSRTEARALTAWYQSQMSRVARTGITNGPLLRTLNGSDAVKPDVAGCRPA